MYVLMRISCHKMDVIIALIDHSMGIPGQGAHAEAALPARPDGMTMLSEPHRHDGRAEPRSQPVI
jgi:hypothetical protein